MNHPECTKYDKEYSLLNDTYVCSGLLSSTFQNLSIGSDIFEICIHWTHELTIPGCTTINMEIASTKLRDTNTLLVIHCIEDCTSTTHSQYQD